MVILFTIINYVIIYFIDYKLEFSLIDHAIVLKNYFPKKNKVTILHERFGKINFYIHEKHRAALLCNGALMYCQIIKKQSTYECDFIDPYYIPEEHLYFVHDVLKICLNFMPSQVMMIDVFNIIIEIYQNLAFLEDCQKKIALLKLFLYLGIFPENKKLYQCVMQDDLLHNHDSDVLLKEALSYCWDAEVNYS